MILDDIDLGECDVLIEDSKYNIKGEPFPSNLIDIYSKEHNYRLTFWTKVTHDKFNELELNKKTDILNYIDDYDIDFGTKHNLIINSRENTNVYFTKIDNNKYILELEIFDFNNVIMGNAEGYKNLKVNAIINFINVL